MKSICETNNLTNLIKQLKCYKNPDNPTCIDMILTNVPRALQSTCVIDTGLSVFHLMTLTIMRKTFKSRALDSLIKGHLNISLAKNLQSL